MWLIIHFFKLLYMLKQVFQDVSVWTQLRLHLCHLFPSQIENSSVRLESYKFIVSKGSVCDTVLKVKTCSAQVKMYVIHVCVPSTALAVLWYQYGPQNWLGGCSGMLKMGVQLCDSVERLLFILFVLINYMSMNFIVGFIFGEWIEILTSIISLFEIVKFKPLIYSFSFLLWYIIQNLILWELTKICLNWSLCILKFEHKGQFQDNIQNY